MLTLAVLRIRLYIDCRCDPHSALWCQMVFVGLSQGVRLTQCNVRRRKGARIALGLSLSNVTGNDYFVNVPGAKLQLDSEGFGREDGGTKGSVRGRCSKRLSRRNLSTQVGRTSSLKKCPCLAMSTLSAPPSETHGHPNSPTEQPSGTITANKPSDRADIAIFQDHLADPAGFIERLLLFDVACVMRERTPLPRNVIERLPNDRIHRGADLGLRATYRDGE